MAKRLLLLVSSVGRLGALDFNRVNRLVEAEVVGGFLGMGRGLEHATLLLGLGDGLVDYHHLLVLVLTHGDGAVGPLGQLIGTLL